MATTSKVGNASIARAAQRVKDAKASGYKTTSKYTEDVQSGKIKAVNPSNIPNRDVITGEVMKPTTPIVLPEQAPVDGLSGVMNGINASLAGMSNGTLTYDPKTGLAPAPQDNSTALFQQQLQSMTSLQNELPSAEKSFQQQQKYLKPKEDAVNRLSGQLNAINQSRDAEMLRLEGQGRGQTSGFIGGEQARINREATIQAMPVQAQLAIAQDDLESARTYASQLFTAQMQDAQNRYNYKKEVNATIFNFLNQQEQRQLALKDKEDDRAFTREQNNLSMKDSWAKTAIEYGQSSVAGAMMALDPRSPTFAEDIARLQGQVRKPVVAQKVDEPKPMNIGTSDKPVWATFDPSTGSFKPISMPGQADGVDQKYALEKADIQMGMSAAKALLANKTGIDLTTGAYQSPFMKTLLQNVGGSILGFGAAGSVVPGIGTVAGLATGAGVGLATAPSAYSYNKTKQDEALASASFLINDTTFNEIINLKARGITFGNMTEGERIAAGRAASELAAAAIIDESGKVTGFRGSDTTITKNVQDILKAYEGRQEYLDRQYSIMPEEESEAANIWGSNK